METYQELKYNSNIINLRDTINEFGVAVIPNVLDENECNELLDSMWNYFETITQSWNIPISRHNQDTWKEIYKLFPLHSMLIQYFNIGHAQFAWNARQNEKIIDIFAHFWNCNKEDLLVSFDGSSFHLPPEVTKRGWNKNHTWYHTDQSFTKKNFECLQSFVTLNDINRGDGTFAFMEGSHRYHQEFNERFNINNKDDWYKLNEEQEQFFIEKGCEYKKIICPKGSLVFWDSRLIHCGVEPMKERENPNIRAVIYLCYAPRRLSNNKSILKKQKAFNEMRTTNHWPCNPKLFPKNPRTYGGELKEITPINYPNVNDLGKKMAGFY